MNYREFLIYFMYGTSLKMYMIQGFKNQIEFKNVKGWSRLWKHFRRLDFAFLFTPLTSPLKILINTRAIKSSTCINVWISLWKKIWWLRKPMRKQWRNYPILFDFFIVSPFLIFSFNENNLYNRLRIEIQITIFFSRHKSLLQKKQSIFSNKMFL